VRSDCQHQIRAIQTSQWHFAVESGQKGYEWNYWIGKQDISFRGWDNHDIRRWKTMQKSS
jgi:hypothetical protein